MVERRGPATFFFKRLVQSRLYVLDLWPSQSKVAHQGLEKIPPVTKMLFTCLTFSFRLKRGGSREGGGSINCDCQE